MYKLRFYIFLGLILLSNGLYSSDKHENGSLDSLFNELATTKDFFEKTNLYFQLGEAYQNINNDSALFFYKKSYEAAGIISELKVKTKASLRIGHLTQYTNPVESVKYSLSSIKHAIELNDSAFICEAYNLLAITYRNQNELEKSMEAYQNALNISEIINDSSGIARAYNGIGIVSMMSAKYEMGLEYWKKSLEIKLLIGNESSAAATMANIGMYYKDIEKFDEAENFLKDALAINFKFKDFESIAFNYKILADLKYKTNKAAQAIDLYKLSINYVDSAKGFLNKEGPYQMLSEIYREQGNYKLAYDYQSKFLALIEHDYSESSNRIKKELSTKYETEKKEKELELLNTQNKAKDAKIKAQNAENELAEAKMMYLTVGLIVSVVLILMTLYFFRRSQKSKKVIESQKMLVEEKNAEITDSINYAKRLQDAILPSLSEVKSKFKDSFILFKPKDIVSGDFYWMETTKTHTFLAAADCTGHGVPGAMVSVVCANALNKSVNELGKTEPAEILNTTRELVIATFAKAGSDVKDGMDISLVAFNKPSEGSEPLKGLNISYAGANNPLWIIRNNATEVEEIKADKQPIGLYGELKPFTSQEVKLNKGDSIYMFSDGFVDQFGGEKGKKFKSKNFKDLLLSIQEKSMGEQRLLIDDAFEHWRGKHEQVDDVCVIGVRIHS